METKKLQLLIDNKLTVAERVEFINEIRKSPELKQELAFLMKFKEIGRRKVKEIVESNKKEKNRHYTFAKLSLSQIRRAAFGQNTSNEELTSLPIKDKTMDDFLNDDDLNE